MVHYIIKNDNCYAYCSINGPIPEDHVDGIVEISEEEYNIALERIRSQQGEISE